MKIDTIKNDLGRDYTIHTYYGNGYLDVLDLLIPLAVSIMLHETGCKWGCSYLVNSCNNVGGQKGSGCGAYSYFDSF